MINKRVGPIGIFDSGLGGLTVLRALRRALPSEDFVYFGDTARVPYGGRSPETIIRYALECADFLMGHDIKLLVIACNTASSYATEILRKQLSIPVVDVITPAVNEAVRMTTTDRLAVLGTRATIGSDIYRTLICHQKPEAQVTSLACPLFVSLVEENFVEHAATDLIIDEYLQPLRSKDIDTVILGCTHYPLLQDLIQRSLGEGVTVLDSATACAGDVVRQVGDEGSGVGKVSYFVSDDPERFRRVGEIFLGCSMGEVYKESLDSKSFTKKVSGSS